MKRHIPTSKTVKRLLIILTALLLSITSIPDFSYATTQDDLDAANAQLNRLKQEQEQLSAELGELTSQLDSAAAQLAAIDTQMIAKQAEIDALQASLEQLELEKTKQYNTMKLRIKYMYEHNSEDTLDLLLSSKSMSEFLTRTEYVRQISEYDRHMLDNLNDILTQETQTHETLLADLSALENLRVQAAAQEHTIKNLIAQKQQNIDSNSENIQKAEALALKYEQDIEAERIARQEAERLAALQNSSSAGTGTTANTTPVNFDASDIAMLAAIIECEAGNQPYQGKLAVGSVVVNRVRDSRFASTVSSVIFSPGQFSPVASGRFAIVLARGASESCIAAAQEVLNGNIVINALYFHVYRPDIDTGGTVIGDHVFY